MNVTKEQRQEFVANWYRTIGTWQREVRREK
jgi:DNA phosphorothioation-dependent restriction protein DptG